MTGGTGFIGSHVVDALLSKGFDVRCIYRKSSNLRWLENKNVELIEASLSNVDSLLRAVDSVDYIFHVAGVVAAKNYDDFLKGNRDATKNLLEATLKKAPNLKRFLHVSSQTAAGPSQSREHPNDENDLCNPITAYGRSKKAAEDVVLEYKDRLPITIVRPPAVYGPRDTATFQIFQVADKGFGTLIGFDKKYVNLIHSDDLVRGIVDSALSDNTKGKIYFVASEEIYNWDEIMDAIKEALHRKSFHKIHIPHFLVYTLAGLSEFFGRFSSKPPIFNFDKGRDFVQKYWTCSVESAKRDFGFQQKINLNDGLNSTIKWYKDNKWF